ncbi:MAG TPA: hypothetical protein VND21_10955 [Planctomycetota bacterium]|nr:hypothetical protein [Planctomycetota bacterium]
MGSFILWFCVVGAAALAFWKFVLEPRRAARAWKEEGEEVYLTTARRLARHTVARVGAEPPET